MSHTHHHNHHQEITEHDHTGKNLLISTLLNLIGISCRGHRRIIFQQPGLDFRCLHNLGDTSALFIAYLANLISKKDIAQQKTFGYKRIEILAALFNAIILVVIIVYLFIEAMEQVERSRAC